MVAQQATVSVAEYLTIEENSQVKHEYVAGAVHAMAGGTLAHDRIANDIRTVINAHLGAGRCALYGPDVRLRVSPILYYYPDAMVICDESLDLGAIEASAPRLIVEVLSDSTEAADRGGKFAHYQTLGSLEEYLLVDSQRRSVELFRRAASGFWMYQRHVLDESVTLETINLTCPIAAFYRRTPF